MAFPVRFSHLARATTSQRYLSGIQSELNKVTEAVVTGLEVHDPSDAPGRWHGILDLQATIEDQAQFQSNATTAESLLMTMESALGDATDIMDRALEIAVGMASETFNDDDRAASAAEVDALRAQMVELGNVSFGDRYPFAGTAYDAPAFDATGAYQGSAAEPNVIVGADALVNTGYDGSTIFPDALQALDDLAVALRSGPGSSTLTRDMLPDLQDSQKVLIAARTTVGHAFNDAEDAGRIAENLELSLQSALDAEVAADPIETYTRLAELQSTYQAALTVTGQAGSSTLFDFLR